MQMSKVNEESIQKLDVIKHLILHLIYPHYSSLSAPYRRQRHHGIKIGGAFGFSYKQGRPLGGQWLCRSLGERKTDLSMVPDKKLWGCPRIEISRTV